MPPAAEDGSVASIGRLLKRTGREFLEDHMTDWAAALTYYGLLSLFPALIALASIVGLFADPEATSRTLAEIVGNLGPETATDTFAGPVRSITAHRTASGLTLAFGFGLSVWAASSYVGAFIRASNVIWETPEGRPFWKLRPLQLGITLASILILALLVLGLVLTGPVVDAVAGPLGIGSTVQAAWNVVKWPVMVLLVLLVLGMLYHLAPNVRPRGREWISPGAVTALLIWMLASAAFTLYVGNFGSYDKTYGTLGGVVSLLVWMWITNLAVLFGAELNSEIERHRELAEGHEKAARQLQLEPREKPKKEGSPG